MFSLFATALWIPQVLAPHLSREKAGDILRLLDLPRQGGDLQAGERRYQELARETILADLRELYSPENESKLQITYAAFTPDRTPGGGADMGLGLSVVKRLILSERVIEVNELWPEDRDTGGLFLPDEIRVKSQVFAGPRHVPGSQGLYLFDALRLAWSGGAEVSLHHRSLYGPYDPNTHRNEILTRRVPVSSPYSCRGCHQPFRHFAATFLAPGETRNYEAIVQDSYFRKPVEQTYGFRDYIAYLSNKPGTPTAFVQSVRDALLDVRRSTRVPGLHRALDSALREGGISWLGEDSGFSDYDLNRDPLLLLRQGVYGTGESGYGMDAIEDVDQGKYLWWFPTDVIPTVAATY